MVAVAVGDVRLVGGLVDEDLRGLGEVLGAAAVDRHAALADLQQELAVARELRDQAVHHRLSAAAVAAEPDIAFVVDVYAVVRAGPLIVVAVLAAPVAEDIARLVEFEHVRSGPAAFPGRRIHFGGPLVRVERLGAMDDPHVILGIDRHADHRADHPMIRQRLGPERVDLESRRLSRVLPLRSRRSSERALRHRERSERDEKRRTHIEIAS